MRRKASGTAYFRDNLPAFLCRIHPAGRSVYLCCIFLVSAIIVCLPLIRVPVTVGGRGLIHAFEARQDIISPVSGMVQEVYVRRGQDVTVSMPLVKIKATGNRHRLQALLAERAKLEASLTDLQGMLQIPPVKPDLPRYVQEFNEYHTGLAYRKLMYEKALREYKRQEGLYQSGLISEMHFDELRFDRDKRKMEVENYITQSFNAWQSVLDDKKDQFIRLNAEIESANEKLDLHTIVAASDGNLFTFIDLAPGSVVRAGQQLGELSPSGPLSGSFHVPSADIGLLRVNMPVRIHIDAFPSREWGTLNGVIEEIPEDCLLLDHQPFYRIVCRLDKQTLSGKHDKLVSLRKGMAFHAQCLVTRRSLFQLLTDRTDRWINPAFGKRDQTVHP